ncbi:MAG: hypothetical protein ACFCVD_19340 [Nodosilinea sp.]
MIAIKVLKDTAYELAEVANTKQLKAKYQAIAALNLRLKTSWQQAVDFLKTNPPEDSSPPKTIAELKSEVYALAQVSTTRQLKAQCQPLRALNFSFKSSWGIAYDLLKGEQTDFLSWLDNPPQEYQELFADIKSTSEQFSTTLEKAKHLGQDAREMAQSFEEAAQAAQAEANRLKQEAMLAAQIAQQARLN